MALATLNHILMFLSVMTNISLKKLIELRRWSMMAEENSQHIGKCLTADCSALKAKNKN